MSQGSLWPHSHFSSYWQSYFPPAPKGPGALGWPILAAAAAAAAPTEARQGKVGDGPQCQLIPTRQPRRSVCHVAALLERPIPGVPRNLTRNTVHRNLRKRKRKDARRTQTSSSSANSAEQPLCHQAGLDTYLWPLLGAGLPSESEPARPQMALATRYPSWVKNLAKRVEARLKLLWAVSSSSPCLSKSKLGAASDLSWPAPLEACITLRDGFSLPTTCLPEGPCCWSPSDAFWPFPQGTWKDRDVSLKLAGCVRGNHRCFGGGSMQVQLERDAAHTSRFLVISTCVFIPPWQKHQLNHQPCSWPFVRLHFITAPSQKKNNLLPRLLKLSQFLLLTQEGQANSFADQAELGGVLGSWGRNRTGGDGGEAWEEMEDFCHKASTWARCQRARELLFAAAHPDPFTTSNAEATTAWSANTISCFPLPREGSWGSRYASLLPPHPVPPYPVPSHQNSFQTTQHPCEIQFCVNITRVLLPLLLLSLTESFTINMFIHLRAGLVLWAPIRRFLTLKYYNTELLIYK